MLNTRLRKYKILDINNRGINCEMLWELEINRRITKKGLYTSTQIDIF